LKDGGSFFLIFFLSLIIPGPVSMVRENVAAGTFESRAYAHEIIAVLVSNSVKTKLISLLDILQMKIK